jgi:O-antigen ligase
MAPHLALTLCLTLIGVLFVVDHQRNPRSSFALWLPTVWMLYAGSRPLAYWFNPEAVAAHEIDYADGSAVDRNFLSICIVLGLFVLARRARRVSAILSDNRSLLVFFSYLAVSLLWSDFFTVSLKRWVRITGDLVMVLIVLSESQPLESIKAIFRRSAFVLLPLSIVLIKYFRDVGVAYSEDGAQTMWIGVTSHKNVLGYVVMGLGLCFAGNIGAAWKSRKVWLDAFLLAMTLWLLGGSSSSRSETSMLGFLLGIAVLVAFYLAPKDPDRIRAYRTTVVTILVVILLSVSLGQSFFQSVVSNLGRDTTLTGRTDIWKAVLAIGPRNPLLGRGYGSFWIGTLGNDVWRQSNIYGRYNQSHNGYIDIYIELGLVGLTLLAWLTWAAYRDIGRALGPHFEYGLFRMTFLLVILIHNITESSFARPTHFVWFVFLLVCTNVRVASPSLLTAASPVALAPNRLRFDDAFRGHR